MLKQWAWPSDPVAMQVAPPLLAFTLTLLILLLLRHWLIKWLYGRWGGEGRFGLIVLETLRFPSVLWCIAAAVRIGLDISIIPDKYTQSAGDRASGAGHSRKRYRSWEESDYR